MKRVFLAFKAPREIIDTALEYKVRNKLSNKVKWSDPTDLHLTVIPPWHEISIDAAKEKLKDYKTINTRFDVKFIAIEPGPNREEPRLVWIKGERNENLTKFRNQLYKIHPDEPRYDSLLPHITLGRGKEKNLKKLEEIKLDLNVKLENIYLYESIANKKNLNNGKKYKLHAIM